MFLITSPALRLDGLLFRRSPRRLYDPYTRSSLPYYRLYARRGFLANDYCEPWSAIKEGVGLSWCQERLISQRTRVRRKPELAVNDGEDDSTKRAQRSALWTAEAVYISWLFLLPYAPGDPVWAISPETISSLAGLSLNFFFVLPLMNNVGIHLLEAPALHPMSEALFNFVIAWTLMFAPLLYTDCKRDRYKGSLDVLWGLMMFLTNTFLIPYMAIRLNKTDTINIQGKRSQLGDVMTNGARVVALVGVAVCVISVWWGLFGRMEGDFGSIGERWRFLTNYVASERLAYAFIWDICLYTIFQPWLIGENLRNVESNKQGLVKYLRYVPVLGLFFYLLFLNVDEEA